MELSMIDVVIAIWAGVATAITIHTRKDLRHHRKLMVDLAEGMLAGEIEFVRDGKAIKVREVKK